MDDFYLKQSEKDATRRKDQIEFVQFLMLRAADCRDAGDLSAAGDYRAQGLRLAQDFDVSADDEMDGRARALFSPLWRASRERKT